MKIRKLTAKEVATIKAKMDETAGMKMLVVQGHISSVSQLAALLPYENSHMATNLITRNLNQLV